MANSIADNTGLSKKTYTYVPPTPPAELIESTIYIVDFAARKFIHVGVDPTDKFKIAIHIITSSRHVQISSDFLKKIFSYMGHILSFILDIPQKYKRVIFHEDNIFKLSSMVYSGENVLVIEVKNREGCRVLLNRKDLMQLQSLEHSIFETIVRKEVFTAPIIAKQYKEIANYLEKKCYEMNSPPKTYEEMKIFIMNTEVDQAVQSIPNFARQIQICAVEQLADFWINRKNAISYEVIQKYILMYKQKYLIHSYFSFMMNHSPWIHRATPLSSIYPTCRTIHSVHLSSQRTIF